jgi:hypothetical protein
MLSFTLVKECCKKGNHLEDNSKINNKHYGGYFLLSQPRRQVFEKASCSVN